MPVRVVPPNNRLQRTALRAAAEPEGSATVLFSEYVRIRQETKRMEEWAERWGVKEAEVLQRRESRELELWMSRIRQILLELQRSTELINDQIKYIKLSF